MGVARMPADISWICIGCWKSLQATPGENPPTAALRGTCAECGAEKVPVTNVKKHSN